MWQFTCAEQYSEDLNNLLKKGWEPFGVTESKAQSGGLRILIIWVKRKRALVKNGD